MHELSIAQSILETALAEAEKHGGKHIRALSVKLGKASHIEPESLELCLEAAAKGTIAEGARTQIEPVATTAKCTACVFTFLVHGDELICPRCGNRNLEIVTGTEVFLESLEVD